ncbi:MAG: hypothetical protein L3K02_09145, partial [Thermoplasmata archaeon]|nr:hypothetical protein [Thermoplasmata archaeon]
MARFSWSAVTLVFVAVGLLTLPGAMASGGANGGGPTPQAGAPPPPGANINATLSLLPGHNLSNLFWGTSVSPRVHFAPNEGDLTAGTPVHVAVWPGAFAGDDFDPLWNSARGIVWQYGNSQVNPSSNESQFVAWCRSINCTAILQVPGEIDSPSIAADIVSYTVNQTYIGPVWEGGVEVNVTIPGLDFRPAYWEIGNEPALWAYWNEPWGQWNSYQTPTATQYAQEEFNYIQAMDRANSSYIPRIIGLPGIGKATSLQSPATWISAVVSLNGPNLSGIATHVYPARSLPSGLSGLVQFYNQIEALDPSSLAQRVTTQERALTNACAIYSCGTHSNATLPIYITEVGTSLSHSSFGGYSETFPGVIGMAIEGIQAMRLPNSTVASLDLYQSVADTTNSWFNTSDAARPTYTLYTRIFTHLGSDVFPINVTGDNNLSAAATLAANDGGRRDLLVTNDNVTTSATFSTNFINRSSYAIGTAPAPAFAPNAPVEIWEWNGTTPAYNGSIGLTTSDPATPVPVALYYDHGLPDNWTLPPQSLALFETYNAPAYPVNFTANLNVPGFAPVAHWYIAVDGWRTSSTEPSLTLLLTPGAYSTQGYPLLMPPKGSDPKSRLMPYLPPTITIGNAWAWENITFDVQWALNLSWNSSRGTVLAPQLSGGSGPLSNGGETWWNNSESLGLQFRPATGYAFDRWDGEGIGSFSGYSLTATIVPTGPVEEQAIFLPGTPVSFDETGLTAGTPWSVSVRGFDVTTTNSSVGFYEINGTWSDQVNNVSGYQLITAGEGAWWQNTLVVGTTPLVLPVNFTPLDQVGPYYTISFTETGLLTGHHWEVALRGVTESANSPGSILFSEHPGAFAFGAGAAGGYNISTPLSFTLAGGPISI